jgi:hypothetical protein
LKEGLVRHLELVDYFDWWESNKSQDFSKFHQIDPLGTTAYRWHYLAASKNPASKNYVNGGDPRLSRFSFSPVTADPPSQDCFLQEILFFVSVSFL